MEKTGLAWVVAVALAVGCGSSDEGSSTVDAGLADAGGDASVPDASTPVPDANVPPADAGVTTVSIWSAGGETPDQACAPWTLVDTSEPEAPITGETILTLGNDINGEVLYYAHDPELLAFPELLVIEARVRFESGAAQIDARTAAGIIFIDSTSDTQNSLYIGQDTVFLLTAENTRGPTAAVATTDEAHTYRIEVDTTTGAIEVFRDGVSILEGAMFGNSGIANDVISWGEVSIVARGVAHWESFQHNALKPLVCP